MALIRCPECGQEISDRAPQCVHCGVRFTVCPECGEAYVADLAACPSCGYATAVEEKDAETDEAQYEGELNVKALHEEWKPESKEALLGKIASWTHLGMVAFTLLLLVVMAFTVRQLSTLLLVVFLVILPLLLVDTALGVANLFFEMRAKSAFSLWLHKKGVDSVALLRASLGLPFSEMLVDEAQENGECIFDWIQGETYYSSPNLKTLVLALEIGARAVDVFCGVIFLIVFSIMITTIKASSIANFFSPGVIICILFFVGGMVLSGILSNIAEKSRQKQFRAMVEKNDPEHLEVYEKYVVHSLKQMFKSAVEKGSREI